MIPLIILLYGIGFVFVWLLHKSHSKSYRTWNVIFERFFYSLFSWVTLVVIFAEVFFRYIFPKEPPKWL